MVREDSCSIPDAVRVSNSSGLANQVRSGPPHVTVVLWRSGKEPSPKWEDQELRQWSRQIKYLARRVWFFDGTKMVSFQLEFFS